MKKKVEVELLGYSLLFESLLCQVMGRKVGYQAASSFHDFNYFKKQIKKVLNAFRNRIDTLDVDQRLEHMLNQEVTYLLEKIGKLKENSDNREIIIETLMIISRLLGYDWMDGGIYRTPIYLRTINEEVMDKAKSGDANYWDKIYDQRNKLFDKRINLIRNLLKEGYTTAQVAYIFKTSDYEIKKIIKEFELVLYETKSKKDKK